MEAQLAMRNSQIAGGHLYALMSFSYRPDIVEQAGIHFDEVVKCILNSKFAFTKLPDRRVCKECDLRGFCDSQGTIKPKERGL